MEISEEATQPDPETIVRLLRRDAKKEGDGHQAAGRRAQEHSWNLCSEGSGRGCGGDGMVENGTKYSLEYTGRQ